MDLAIPQVVRHKPTGDLLITVERYGANLPGDLPERERIELAWMILTGCRPDRMGTLS